MISSTARRNVERTRRRNQTRCLPCGMGCRGRRSGQRHCRRVFVTWLTRYSECGGPYRAGSGFLVMGVTLGVLTLLASSDGRGDRERLSASLRRAALTVGAVVLLGQLTSQEFRASCERDHLVSCDASVEWGHTAISTRVELVCVDERDCATECFSDFFGRLDGTADRSDGEDTVREVGRPELIFDAARSSAKRETPESRQAQVLRCRANLQSAPSFLRPERNRATLVGHRFDVRISMGQPRQRSIVRMVQGTR